MVTILLGRLSYDLSISIGIVPDRIADKESDVFFGDIVDSSLSEVNVAPVGNKYQSGPKLAGAIGPISDRAAPWKQIKYSYASTIVAAALTRFGKACVAELEVGHVSNEMCTVVKSRVGVSTGTYVGDAHAEHSPKVFGCRLNEHQSVKSKRSVQSLKYSRRAHSAADAHGDHAVTLAGADQFVQHRSRQFRSRAAQGMAESDGSAVDVDL